MVKTIINRGFKSVICFGFLQELSSLTIRYMTNLWTRVYRVVQFEYYSHYPWAYMRDELLLLELSLSRGFVTTAVKIFRNYLNEWKRENRTSERTSENRSGQKCRCPETVKEVYICEQYLQTSGTNTRLKCPVHVLEFGQNSENSEGTKDEEFNFADYPVSATLP